MKKCFPPFRKVFYHSLAVFLLGLCILSCKKNIGDVDPEPGQSASAPASDYDAVVATAWIDLQMHLISSTPGFESPVAARSLAYSSLALYESMHFGMPGFKSLENQLNGLGNMPKPDTTDTYHWGLVASTAQYTLIRDMYSTTSDVNKIAIDSVRSHFETELKKGISDPVVDRSIRLGAEIATAVWNYSKTDGGQSGSLENYPANYSIPTGIGYWKPTGGQTTPLLPYWGKNRPFVTSNKTANAEKPVTFSFDKNSDFFKEAKYVQDSAKILTAGQKEFVDFWRDGQGTIATAGHHFNIASQILKKEKVKLDKAAEVYVKLGLALNDAHISAWKAKYTYYLMRPSTYIRKTLNPSWTPYMASPPYPEYASLNATSAGASAGILDSIFGETYAFEDDSHKGTQPKRNFANFAQFAREASLAGFYSGTQYYFSGQKGRENGYKIAANVLKLKFKK
jgi:hypothetical protein